MVVPSQEPDKGYDYDQGLELSRRVRSRPSFGAWSANSPGGSLNVNNETPEVGRSAITEVARSFMPAFPDMQLVMDKVLVQADRIEYYWK